MQKQDLQENEEEKRLPIGEILAFFTGFLILVFIALIISNLSGTLGGGGILNGNIHPLFDHQTVHEDNNRGNMQTINKDSLRNTQIKNRNSISGIDAIVPIAELGEMTDFEVEPGTMTFYDSYIPTELPICLTETELDSWELYVDSHGSYHPYQWITHDGKYWFSYVDIYNQKPIPERVGRVRIDWNQIYPDDAQICHTYWKGEFNLPPGVDYIKLESSHIPSLSVDDGGIWTYPLDEDGNPIHTTCDYIPGKLLDLRFTTYWSGCHLPEQAFTIISVRD